RIFRYVLERLGGTEPHVQLIVELLEFLRRGHFLVAAELHGAREARKLLQVNAEVIRLQLVREEQRFRCEVCSAVLSGTSRGTPSPRCHGRLIPWPEADVRQNRTVRRILAPAVVPLVAGEHTAQIPNAARLALEDEFKAPADESKVNVLACSPTLEMGID